MKIIFIFIVLCLSAKAFSDANLVLKNGYVLDIRRKLIEKRDVYICNGKIVDINKGAKCSPKILDVSGKWLIPGLADMHIHARGQSSASNLFEDLTPYQESKVFLKAGVTKFLDAMNDETIIFRDRNFNHNILCAGAAFTPTKGHGTEYGLPASSYRIVDDPAGAYEQIAAIKKYQPDVIKIMYDHRGFDGSRVKDGQKGVLGVAMKKEVMQALISASRQAGLKPYVHIGVWQDARESILAGSKIINHLGETAIPEALVSLARKNRVYWIPTLTLYHEYVNLIDTPKLLDDPLLQRLISRRVIRSYRPSNIYKDPEYIKFQMRHKDSDPVSIKRLRDAGITIVAGSDTIELGTFMGWSLHRELALLNQYGLSPWDSLAAGTINAGDMIGKQFDLEPGAEGNVLILTASPIDDIWNTTKMDAVINRGDIINI